MLLRPRIRLVSRADIMATAWVWVAVTLIDVADAGLACGYGIVAGKKIGSLPIGNLRRGLGADSVRGAGRS